ncbi:Protein Y53G8B.2 [Aphelenchoides avenae]|nr:Protein Y53G8B.2 [Aphelenchus avenae]
MFLILPLPLFFISVYILLFTSYWWLILPYLCWMYYDRGVINRGGRASEPFRKQNVWKHFADYFPIKLVKTAELPLDKNYIFGNHPHGIMSIGSFASFCTNGTGFDKIVPGIKRHACTLASQFNFPFRREIVLQSGAISSSAESIEYVLRLEDKGHAVSIVLGGAEEALDAHADNYDLKLSTRKGFIRLAIKHGASLVPVYHFGENRIYYQRYSRTRSRPTKEIDKVHAEYCRQLVTLFDDNKEKYGVPANAKLNIY